MKHRLYSILILLLSAQAGAVAQETAPLRHEVLLETDSGNVRIALYNETPRHRDNFLKLVRRGAYNGMLFHRVIPQFMCQTGDLGSKNAKPGALTGTTPEQYKVPAEILYPQLFHHYGAVAAARDPDDMNPDRKSSASQFYIVVGSKWTDYQLDALQKDLNAEKDSIQLTTEVREAYKTIGGTPHLDGTYTVFGEVVEGMDVIERIQQAATDSYRRPLTDIRVRKATVITNK